MKLCDIKRRDRIGVQCENNSMTQLLNEIDSKIMSQIRISWTPQWNQLADQIRDNLEVSILNQVTRES